MRRRVEHRAMAIAGYAEPWSGPAGGTRRLSLSSDRPIRSARIRRLDRDGMPVESWSVEALPGAVEHRDLPQGAWAEIADLSPLVEVERIGFELKLTRNDGRRVLLDAGGFALVMDGDALLYRTGTAEMPLAVLPTQSWLELVLDWPGGTISAATLDPFKPFYVSAAFVALRPKRLVFCSDAAETVPTLNCRLARLGIEGSGGVAEWRFPTLFTESSILASGLPVALRLHGNPTFCLTSARWDGSSLEPRLTPAHYDAIHFHDTDMAGLDWPASYSVAIPAEAPSGVYAFEVDADDAVERIAFFVTARRAEAPLLFVVPTATYLAYADEFLPPHLYPWIGTDRGHEFARDNRLRSLYDYHADGSGVSLASTRRPKATLRDDYRYPLCGDPHGLPVDLHFLRFCAREGIAIDLVTDRELHEAGAGLLKQYGGVVTGSHPEYLSGAMELAYRDYIGADGRLAYLGGNGFAAAVAFAGELMELRRGPTQAGRTWDGPLAEMALALTNEPGGYFRDRGRGEHRLVGVGIALMGFSRALPFTRTEASYAAEFGWLFEGVGETFGMDGIVLGGAAGYEVDCVDFHLGSPADVVVLASATGFPPDYVDDPGRWHEGGAGERQRQRRADMTWWQHPRGGVVFSASSVAWCGALPGRDDDNEIGRLTRNLLRHFAK